jgi:cyclohexanone monooxygenase
VSTFEEVLHDTLGDVDFDAAALKAHYLIERDKRLRPDANDQYIEVAGDFTAYVDDPYAEPIERDPLSDHSDIVIIGGGFGGLLMGGRLREAGFDDIRVIEKGGDFGGTWYWNRYPGAMCDVESYCYLPMLEELDYMPKHKYSYAPEIMEHSRNIARHYGLYDNALMSTEVNHMSWDGAANVWRIETDRGDRLTARIVVTAAARHRRHRRVSRPHVPHQPVGLRLHRWRQRRRADRARRQTGRDHRHRCHGGAVRSPPRRLGAGAVRLSANPFLGRRAQQP